ncbi:MAG: MATE family efflux transporter, partial [Lentisphaeria bacterium]|nr:MATE family efflux transporter [Lentisphaeria bacterium]
MKTSGKKNLTRGNMAANLLAFSVPFLLANLLQALYSAVDLWVVGKFGGGKIGVAAVSNGGELMHLVMSFIMGLTTGATVLIGRYFGAGNQKNTQRSIGMTLSFSLLTGLAATCIFVLL